MNRDIREFNQRNLKIAEGVYTFQSSKDGASYIIAGLVEIGHFRTISKILTAALLPTYKAHLGTG